jgi:outer membrane protein assembly factor BamB
MRQRWAWAAGFLLALLPALTGPAALAVITRLTPLGEVLKEEQYICLARVDKLDAEKRLAVLAVKEDLKGQLPCRRMTVHLKGDSEGKKEAQVPKLLKRLAPELPIVLFANQFGKRLTIFAYTEGTWFQMTGQPVPDRADAAVLTFTHFEPFFRRTFKGTTTELRQVIVDGLSGKRAPPAPNPKEPPGLGPEIKAQDGARGSLEPLVPTLRVGTRVPAAPRPEAEAEFSALLTQDAERPELAFPCGAWERGAPTFAVIPTIGLGGPLAILALLFPSLFGGVLVLFRRWAAFFTVLSVNSLLVFLHMWADATTWWGSDATVMLVIGLVNLLGLGWAWRRHLTFLQTPGAAEPPARTEYLVLWLLSIGCAATLLIYYWLTLRSWREPVWQLLLSLSIGIWVGTGYKLCAGFLRRSGRTPLATEGVILWGTLCAFLVLATMHPGLRVPAGAIAAEEQSAGDSKEDGPRFQKDKTWSLIFGARGSGMVVSSPRIVGDRAYVAAAHKQGLNTFGAVYCVDLASKKVLWTFDDDRNVKQIFSSPCLVRGKLYIGEGFHDDVNCKVYCLDAKSGKELWNYQTASQTEGSPLAVGDTVYIGAGDEGVLALDAANGKKRWQFPDKQDDKAMLRVGGSPAVAGKRLFIGSGVDRNSPDNPGETAVFCLDTDTGKLLWKVKTDLPFWGTPVVAGENVFFGLGNGDLFTDAAKPGGAVLCLEGQTGKEVWRTDLPNGVLEKPALDWNSVYCGCRDGCCYCLNRYSGKQRWKKDLGSPVVAAPALDQESTEGTSSAVFVVADAGKVACLEPSSGRILWAWNELQSGDTHLISSPWVVLTPTAEGERRQVYFGAALSGMSIPALYSLEDLLPR